MKREAAEKLMNETRATYDAVAKEFSDSRAQFWPELSYLAEHGKPGTKALDIGCGNGRLLSILSHDVEYVGLDYSSGLLEIARLRHPDRTFIEGDATALPFHDGEFSTIFSFATLHHIPSRELRTKAIREAARVLTPGGTLIITVWHLWQTKHWRELLGGMFRAVFSPSTADIGDVLFTFGKEKKTRYLHGFTKRELLGLLTQNGFTVLDSEIIARGGKHRERNLVAVARKK